MRGPKRANNIRKLFALNKTDDVRKYVKTYSRTVEKDGKSHLKSPKIQRLITPLRLQRKRHIQSLKKRKISKVRLRCLGLARPQGSRLSAGV